jgi:FlaA1/EpsC-like NDP-sugar epimerase
VSDLHSRFKDKRILVTGACGTIGSRLVNLLLSDPSYSPAEVVGVDNNESELFFLDQRHLHDPRAHFFFVDVRDRSELIRKTIGVDIIFHCAALKHVVVCERSPEQATQTNILGVQNVIAAAQANSAEKVIFTSSDKAVNPTNVMGTSKLMGERLMTAANSSKRSDGPIFASTRFGNVLGSNGSVVPIFHNQIASLGQVTLTHRDMTRFIMSIDQAVRLVIDTALLCRGGEVFITKMPVIRIRDLAEALILELAPVYGRTPGDVTITEIGTKPGEKLYEELMSQEETRRSKELERYFVVLPAFRGIYRDIEYTYQEEVGQTVTDPYVSADQVPLGLNEIRQLLKDYGLLKPPADGLKARYWPGDKEQG